MFSAKFRFNFTSNLYDHFYLFKRPKKAFFKLMLMQRIMWHKSYSHLRCWRHTKRARCLGECEGFYALQYNNLSIKIGLDINGCSIQILINKKILSSFKIAEVTKKCCSTLSTDLKWSMMTDRNISSLIHFRFEEKF